MSFFFLQSIFFLLLSFSLVGNGCTQTSSADKQPFEKQEKSSSSLLSYTDPVLGISFDYPASWKQIMVKEEQGFYNQEEKKDKKGNLLYDGVIHRNLLVDNGHQSLFFLSAHDKGTPLRRGGFLSDLSDHFHSQEQIEIWCEEQLDCEMVTTSSGLHVAHAYTAKTEIWGEPLENIDVYAIFHPNHAFGGIVIFNLNFVKEHLGREEEAFQ